jgi:hypothetical protein
VANVRYVYQQACGPHLDTATPAAGTDLTVGIVSPERAGPPRLRSAAWRGVRIARMDGEVHDSIPAGGTIPDRPPVEEWPPRAWRETTRSAGHRQALYVVLSIVLMFVILTFVNIWGSHQG